MIFGCLFTLLALIFSLLTLLIVGVSITFTLFLKIALPFILIGLGISIIKNHQQ